VTERSVITVGNDRSSALSFHIDTAPVMAVIHAMPKVAYYWLREFFFGSFHRHRVHWLGKKNTRFGRAGKESRAIRVSRVNDDDVDPSSPITENEVRYLVRPFAKRMPTPSQAERGLAEMQAEAATGNTILKVHEEGANIAAKSGFMFLPQYKTNQHAKGDIRKWIKDHPTARLKFLPSKKDGRNKTMVYEITTPPARRGRPRKGASPPPEKLKLRWIGQRLVVMKPTLQFYAAWDDLKGERDGRFGHIADRMFEDMQKADRRDV
jgi:hypothetical protein